LIPLRATDEQLFELWHRDGDRRARERLITRYLPMARRLANRYAGRREPADDLLQVASVALIKAVDRFDATRGTAFAGFAVPTVVGELKRHFRDLGWTVHVSRTLQEMVLKVEAAEPKLTALSGRSPSVPEIALYLELSIEDVLDALECATAHTTVSLDVAAHDDEEGTETLVDQLGAVDAHYESVETKLSVDAVTARLRPRERRILELRFVEEMTQAEIAARIGISQMHVSRILRRTLARLADLS
jgi:RNA polymerase sigma-B factor